MTEVRNYIARPIKVEAVQLVQYGDFVRAAAWISESKGKTSAYFKPKSKINGNVDTLILLKDGNVYDVFAGDYIVLRDGDFSHVQGDLFESAFDELLDDDVVPADWDTIGSHYQPTGKPGKSLLGGAALQVPV